MQKTKALILWLFFGSLSFGSISLRICNYDSNSPIDCNAPIMVGTKLTIYADSNSPETIWLGGIDLIKSIPDSNLGRLFGRNWDANTLDFTGSHLTSAGNRATVTDWENTDQQSFELHVSGSDVTSGPWFVIDYNACNTGDSLIKLVQYNGSQITTLMSRTLHQVANCDFNHDGSVDFRDFAKLAMYWMHTDCNDTNHCDGTDLNSVPDGKVDFLDLMLFAQFWLNPAISQTQMLQESASSQSLPAISTQTASLEGISSASPEQMSISSLESPAYPPIYLSCDTNSLDPNQEVTIYVNSPTPLFCLGLGVYITGDANITDAMKESDCNSYGWDNGWNSNPYIDPNGKYVYLGSVRWNADANGVVGYLKIRYNGGDVNAYTDTVNSSAFTWNAANDSCYPISFSTDVLVFTRKSY
jgi:hypothetical protein